PFCPAYTLYMGLGGIESLWLGGSQGTSRSRRRRGSPDRLHSSSIYPRGSALGGAAQNLPPPTNAIERDPEFSPNELIRSPFALRRTNWPAPAPPLLRTESVPTTTTSL